MGGRQGTGARNRKVSLSGPGRIESRKRRKAALFTALRQKGQIILSHSEHFNYLNGQ